MMVDSKPTWREVACPKCGAPAGQQCLSGTGKPTKDTHADRFKVAREAGLPTPLLGYPRDGEQPHIVTLEDKTKAICGASIDTIPELQPRLSDADPKCRNLLGKVPYRRDTTVTGVCPVCVSEEDLDDDGRIRAHKQMFGDRRTGFDCDGAGELPDGDG